MKWVSPDHCIKANLPSVSPVIINCFHRYIFITMEQERTMPWGIVSEQVLCVHGTVWKYTWRCLCELSWNGRLQQRAGLKMWHKKYQKQVDWFGFHPNFKVCGDICVCTHLRMCVCLSVCERDIKFSVVNFIVFGGTAETETWMIATVYFSPFHNIDMRMIFQTV